MQNIQFIMFGQMIPKNGWKTGNSDLDKAFTQYKSMRTQDLEQERQAEKERLDDSIQFKKSREEMNLSREMTR